MPEMRIVSGMDIVNDLAGVYLCKQRHMMKWVLCLRRVGMWGISDNLDIDFGGGDKCVSCALLLQWVRNKKKNMGIQGFHLNLNEGGLGLR